MRRTDFYIDLAYYTPGGETVGLTEDEARWISIACTGSSRNVDRHITGGPRLMLTGIPVTIIPDDWAEWQPPTGTPDPDPFRFLEA